MILKIVRHIDDHFDYYLTTKYLTKKFVLLFLLLIQKMETKIMDEKAKIAYTHKIFKELISLYSDKIRDLSSYDYYFQDIEEDIEDDDEKDLDYLETLHINIAEQFRNFHIEYNINQVPKDQQPIINNLEKINNS